MPPLLRGDGARVWKAVGQGGGKKGRDMLTIGYVGNGKSTNRYHLPYVLQREDIRVKTIYNPRIHHDVWPQVDGVAYTTDLDSFMGDPELDLIVVCTVHQHHYQYARMALEHGRHVLVEKPFMQTYAQARELFSLAKEKGLLIQCYQNRRYDSDFLTVQKVIEDGKLGDLLEVEMHFDYYRPEVPESSTRFRYDESFLYSHGCHTIDQVVSYFGEPESVRSDVRCILGKGHMSDYFDLDLYYGGLKVSVKSSYFRVKARPGFVVYGRKGMFVKQTPDRQEEHLKLFYLPGQPGFGRDGLDQYGTLTYVDEAGAYHEEKVPSEQGDYGRVYDALYDTLVNGAPPKVTDDQTLCVMRILEEGAKAVEGKEVDLI